MYECPDLSKPIIYCTSKPIVIYIYIYIAMEAIGHTLYQFNSVVTHLGNHELEVYGLQTF